MAELGTIRDLNSFKDIPRVPHADESGMQIGTGGIPPNRRYASGGEAVDWRAALANLEARKRGEMPLKVGGLDDEDPALYNNNVESSPFGKMKVAQHGTLSIEAVKRLKAGKARIVPAPKADKTVSSPPAEELVVGSLPEPEIPGQKVVVVSDGSRPEDFLPSIGGPAGTVESPKPDPFETPGDPVEGYMDHRTPAVSSPQVIYRDRIIEKPVVRTVEKPVEKIVERIVEKPVDSPFTEWIRKRVKVHITLTETMFMVSAVDVVKSIHGITVLMPTEGDGILFIPKPGTKVVVACKDKDVAPTETMFTGVSFDIMELGVMGLAFLIPKDRGEADTHEP